MPNIKSAKKRVKVIKAKTLQNKMYRSALKTEIKKYDAALASGDVAAAQAAYRVAVKKIDQAAAYGIIHKNAAARETDVAMLHTGTWRRSNNSPPLPATDLSRGRHCPPDGSPRCRRVLCRTGS